MEMSGEQLIPATQQDTWDALNDPEVLKACIPGCEAITLIADNEYQVQMVARVGPVSAKFRGRLTLSDVRPPESYSIAFEGQGGPAGFAKGGARVKLSGLEGQTKLAYDVKASVGGKLAQIGSRLVDAAAKKVADDFFRNFTQKLSIQAHEGNAVVSGHAKAGTHDEHPPASADADQPKISDMTVAFFAAGALVVFIVALLVFLR
ncbi:MAG TPA: carbon monoxide dehydrogenase subunit G [Burkholderiales bacterium]|nr:carbon monoxide dehydrogenase subunit G [Burkholderiales bacterium]